MPLESASYINGLVSSNPAGTDSEGQGAAHLRLIKATLLATFPNLTGPMTATQALLNLLTSGNAGVTMRGPGMVPLGSMHAFPADPGSTLVARGGTATGTEQYIECDGSTYLGSKFPDLYASGLVTVAAPNFTVPLLTDTGRFLRSRIPGTTAAGVSQANQFASHTHVNTLTDPGHTHTVTDPGHVHTITDPGHTHTINQDFSATGGAGTVPGASSGAVNNTPATNSNTTGITINSHTTGITNVSNTTGITITNAAAGTGSETRPESFSVLWVLKT